MGLNRQHQLQLIKDILTDHQLDCCGTVAEYEQVGRVIQFMLAKEDLDAD
ncbi:YtzH-like family protein, partial [Bacillus pumilus]